MVTRDAPSSRRKGPGGPPARRPYQKGRPPRDRGIPSVRTAARACLSEIERSAAHSDVVLEQISASIRLPDRDRPLLHEIVLGVLRRLSLLDWIIEQAGGLSAKGLSYPILQILRIGVYQLLFLDRVPPHAAVNEAVEDAKRVEGSKSPGFVNAVLRKVADDREGFRLRKPEGTILECLVIETSHPLWLVRRWKTRWGREVAEAYLRANNEIPPVTLRVNRLKTDRERLMTLLRERDIPAEPTAISPVGIRVGKGGSPTRFPGFSEGFFYIQDEGAQLVGLLVGAQPGERLLDACAAPGGKAFHLAEQMEGKGEVVALDPSAERLGRLRANAHRLGAGMIRIEEADAVRGLHFADRRGFARVLVDAPCTALGTLRRHPEARWNREAGSIRDFASLQLKILSSAAPWVKPGGELVYSTCTTEPEENEGVAARFLERFSEFESADPMESLPEAARPFVGPDGFFRTFPHGAGMDGFFAARWIKRRRT